MKRRGFELFCHLRLATIEKLFKFRRYKVQEECLAFSPPSVVRAAGKRTSPFAAEIVIECELLDKIGNPPKICALQAGISRPTIGSCEVRFQSCRQMARLESCRPKVGSWQGSVGRTQHDLGPLIALEQPHDSTTTAAGTLRPVAAGDVPARNQR